MPLRCSPRPDGEAVSRQPSHSGVRVIEYRDISKSFGDHEVLSGLNLSIGKGEKLAIIGPSGSGKTTILRLLMGLERPTSGQILLEDELVWDEPGKLDERRVHRARRRMGFVFQQFNFFPHMTVLRNVAAGLLYTRKVPVEQAEQRAREMLDLVGLGREGAAVPVAALGWPAATRRDRARARDGSRRDAVRRAHLGARPGARR